MRETGGCLARRVSHGDPGSGWSVERLAECCPGGCWVGWIEKPTVLEVGQSPMLVADINVSTYYTQTN